MLEHIRESLHRECGIQALSIQEIPGGWSAFAYRVHAGEADLFLKVYDKRRQSTKRWLARLGDYMPVVLWLHENTSLRDRITAPLLTKGGDYKWEDDACLYMVYPFIQGSTLCESRLTPEQVRQIAQIVAELHAYGSGIPVPTGSLRETFDTPFCGALGKRLEELSRCPEPVAELTPHFDVITEAIAALQKTEAALRKTETQFVLCHTDIHGWNLMQAGNLILIDWEGLQLAPAEADLFAFTKGFFFEDVWEDFMSVYRAMHPAYRVNAQAMGYYRLRRRLDDIHEFLESMLRDDLTQEDMDRSRYYLLRECALLPETIAYV